ncbi:RNA-binding protein 42-like [Anneissia japonica]|uniref:RNA-binding protein 42-like n=1 Tax=Anneissia japonica TaxID=1529436 RepID=UPI001425765D|nr:RNA-binding protein 42-like [Anneissia japonica]
MANNYSDTRPSQYGMDKMKEMEEEMSRFEEEILGRNAQGDADAINQLQGGGGGSNSTKPFQFPFAPSSHNGAANSSAPQAKFPGDESMNYRVTGPAGFPPQPPMVQGSGHPRQGAPGPPAMQPPGMRMGGPPGVRIGGPPGVRMGGPPGVRMGGPPGIRMGGPPGIPGPRQMKPSFIPHQLQQGSHPGMSRPMRAPPMPPLGVMMDKRSGMMPMPMMSMKPMKPKTISAAPTIYAAKPVKFTNTEEKVEEKEKAVETSATAEINKAVPQKPIQSHTPVIDPMMYQPHAIMQHQHQQHHQQNSAMAGQEAVPVPKKTKKKKVLRTAAGQTWEDDSLQEWNQNDFRIFCGDLGNEVNDDTLTKAFNRYPSFLKAKVVRDKRNGKSKGYGFVSFKDPNDFVQAMREMNGKYVGNRPIKLRKSMWKERNIETAKKKTREKQRLGLR